ncbi:MAG: type II secretion system F family protein [Anaerolineales bacterium]|jgi:tight adherence protein B|nr:type II secretion system F family protein [Anaerolineales bacterium]
MAVFIIGGGIAMAVVILIIGIVVSLREDRSVVDERLGRYLQDDDAALEENVPRTPLTDWINARVEGSNSGGRIAQQLAQADLKLKPGEYVGLIIIAMFGVGFLGFFLGRDSGPLQYVFAGIGAVVGYFIPGAYVNNQKVSRLERFNDQLPDMLNLAVNGLRAGYSTVQALESVSKELPSPISDEFRRVVREMQIGITMGDALENLLRRIPSPDLDLIITAINIQREVGGNLAEILDIISYTIRERIRIKREIKVLVTQVLYSGRVLALLPIALACFLWMINPSYMNNIVEYWQCGIPLFVCGTLMIGMGYFVMTRIANIEV